MAARPMPSALIDVLIPVHNGARTIEESIRCIQNQTLRDIRIVVVDDGSTDGTAAILKGLAATDARLHVIHQPNGGIVDALNTGLGHCTAEFVARHDADDIAFPERLARQIEYLREHSDTIAVSADVHIIDEHGARNGRRTRFSESEPADALRIPPREPFLMHPFLMVRREVVERAGRYRYVFHAEDADLYWRLLPHGRLHNFGLFGEYRVHSDSVTSRSVRNGRVNAISSQLAALSYLRRVAGRDDLVFEKSTLQRYHDAQTLAGMVAVASEQLDGEEARRLRIGAAAKLFEMALYRPYSLDREDCAFGRQAMARDISILREDNARDLRIQHLYLGALLVRRGHLQLARAACSPAMFLKIASHFLAARMRRLQRK